MNWFNWAQSHLKASREPAKIFTPRTAQVLAVACKESERLKHNYVGVEHILLGLIRLGQGVADHALVTAGMTIDVARAEVEKQAGIGAGRDIPGIIPYTPRAKKVVELAKREARALGHTYVGTEHLLLGLLADGDGPAAVILRKFKVEKDGMRNELINQMTKAVPPPQKDAKEGS